MSLSYALGDDADLRRRLLVRIGAPLTVRNAGTVLAAGKNHTAETPSADALEQITSAVYRAAQGGNAVDASSATGDSGAL